MASSGGDLTKNIDDNCREINDVGCYPTDLNWNLAAIGQELPDFERSSICGRQRNKGGSSRPNLPGRVMSFGTTRKSSLQLELQTVEETSQGQARLFVVLPSLEQLLGEPAFGHHGPIFLPGHGRPLDGWGLFGSVRERGIVLH